MSKNYKTITILVILILITGSVFAYTSTSNLRGNLAGLRSSESVIGGEVKCIDFSQLNFDNLAYDERGVTSPVISTISTEVASAVPSIVTTEVSTIVNSEVVSEVPSNVTSRVHLDIRCFTLSELIEINRFMQRELRSQITEKMRLHRNITNEINKLNFQLQSQRTTNEVQTLDRTNLNRQQINVQQLQRTIDLKTSN
jgi:hypothetical protein